MATPKRRTSKARRDRRRAHDALPRQSMVRCSNCAEWKLPHRVCKSCGFYRDKEVVSVDDDA